MTCWRLWKYAVSNTTFSLVTPSVRFISVNGIENFAANGMYTSAVGFYVMNCDCVRSINNRAPRPSPTRVKESLCGRKVTWGRPWRCTSYFVSRLCTIIASRGALWTAYYFLLADRSVIIVSKALEYQKRPCSSLVYDTRTPTYRLKRVTTIQPDWLISFLFVPFCRPRKFENFKRRRVARRTSRRPKRKRKKRFTLFEGFSPPFHSLPPICLLYGIPQSRRIYPVTYVNVS